jgi:hypothetical protein
MLALQPRRIEVLGSRSGAICDNHAAGHKLCPGRCRECFTLGAHRSAFALLLRGRIKRNIFVSWEQQPRSPVAPNPALAQSPARLELWRAACAHRLQRAGAPAWATPVASLLSAPVEVSEVLGYSRRSASASPARAGSAPRLRHFPQSPAPTFPAEAVVGAGQRAGGPAPVTLRKVATPGLSAAAPLYAARRIFSELGRR